MLVDATEERAYLTLWNDDADVQLMDNEVVVLKNAQLSVHNGVLKLTKKFYTTLLIDPDMPQVHGLKEWFKWFLIRVGHQSSGSKKKNN